MRVARAALWWLISLAVFYALTEDQPYLQENIAAGALAVCGTAVVMVAAANWGGGVRIPFAALRPLYRLFRRIPVGVVTVSSAILRAVLSGSRLGGRIRHVPFGFGEQDDPEAIGRRAVAAFASSIAPNTILVDFAPDDDEVLVHRL